jgi:hypothetical protein
MKSPDWPDLKGIKVKLERTFRPPCPRMVERARIALREVMDGKSYARAVFRLLLATVRGEYAAAHFHTVASPTLQWGAWISSNGMTMSDTRLCEIDKDASGYAWITAQIQAGKLPRVALSSWALTPKGTMAKIGSLRAVYETV